MSSLSKVKVTYLLLAASLLSHVERDTMRLFLGGQHVDVVGNEELSSPDDRRSPARDELGEAVIRSPLWLHQLQEKTFICLTHSCRQ